jgi:prepilin-type processing-associated H-X9-DG protein
MINVSNIVVAASLLFLFQSATVPPAHSGDGHFVLTNNTREQIIEIYVSDDRTDNWQEDLLGLEFLLSGSSVSVDVDDRNGNCRVDVKTVLSNGSSLVYRGGVNACLADGHAILIR